MVRTYLSNFTTKLNCQNELALELVGTLCNEYQHAELTLAASNRLLMGKVR